jgi:hypothetical protein
MMINRIIAVRVHAQLVAQQFSAGQMASLRLACRLAILGIAQLSSLPKGTLNIDMLT